MKKLFIALAAAAALLGGCKKKDTAPATNSTVTPPVVQNHTLEFRVYCQPDSAWVTYTSCCGSGSFNQSQMVKSAYFSTTKTIQQQSAATTYHLGATPYNYDTLIVQILLDGQIKAADTAGFSSAAVDWVY